MEEVTIAGKTYRTVGKMNCLKQFHVARRIAPALRGFTIALEKFKAAMKPGVKPTMLELVDGAQPLCEALSKIPDDDANYIVFECMNQIRRKDGDLWAKVRSESAADGTMQYDDIDLVVMMQLVNHVLMENLGGFFPTAP